MGNSTQVFFKEQDTTINNRKEQTDSVERMRENNQEDIRDMLNILSDLDFSDDEQMPTKDLFLKR